MAEVEESSPAKVNAWNEIPTGRVKQCVRQLEQEATIVVEQFHSLSVDDKEFGETTKTGNGTIDGNDSGVDTGVTPITLQRALSNNSGGYASSSNGADAQFASCNSSLLSVCSDTYKPNGNAKVSIDCTSEGGSESSSLSNGPTSKRSLALKRRVGVVEPSSSSSKSSTRKSDPSTAKNRTRAASSSRAIPSNGGRPSIGAVPMLATTERARSREKQMNTNSCRSVTLTRSVSLRRPVELPNCLSSPMVPRMPSVSRTPSVNRRTPSCTPSTDDGRWPSVGSRKNFARNTPAGTPNGPPDTLVIKTKVGPIVLDNKTNGDRFSTLPRRRREKSDEDLREFGRTSRSNSVTRDRMTSSAIVRWPSSRESTPAKVHVAKNRKTSTKTLIYHEAAVQTAITCRDIDDAFAGNAKDIRVDTIATTNQESQVDIRDKEIEKLHEQLKRLAGENVSLQQTLDERTQAILSMEQQLLRERDEKNAMEIELKSNTERVLSMLEMVHVPTTATVESATDSLLMLESQIQLSGYALEKKQTEIDRLRSFCTELQTEMSRSIRVQQNLVEERKCFERETTELQDFLQDEKMAIVEALKDAEADVERLQNDLKKKEQDLERLQDECRHLVRIGEQRRQEFLGMKSKYTALETKSKDLIAQQNHAVAGATIALSELGLRLSNLVDQLVSSYSISEQELEDVIFHNEAYTNSGDELSPDVDNSDGNSQPLEVSSMSSQRRKSFMSAVIKAIKCAATSAKQSVYKKCEKTNDVVTEDLNSDTTEMLDSETEPCLMMENVLEDSSIPDSHSQNMISSTNSLLMVTAADSTMNKDEESLHNLCAAIVNRQKIEQQATLMMTRRSSEDDENSSHESIGDVSSISEQNNIQSVVDHAINVDNLVTKLLKVLHIIQDENDKSVRKLIAEKETLKLSADEMSEQIKQWERTNLKLKSDLGIASEQLAVNCSELTNKNMELLKQRNEINQLNEDIRNLSSISLATSMPETCSLSKDSNGCVTNDVQSSLENQSSQTNQNVTITKAIECPDLFDLQRDLELMLPTDFNANAANVDLL